jgi:hypothetical protein
VKLKRLNIFIINAKDNIYIKNSIFDTIILIYKCMQIFGLKCIFSFCLTIE